MTSSLFDTGRNFQFALSGRTIVPPYRLRDSLLPSGHDVLPPPVQTWLETSCRNEWHFCKWTCQFLFDDQQDAAMFKVAWL